MENAQTPLEILNCLKDAVRHLSQSAADLAALGADDIFPLLIFLLLQSHCKTVFSDLEYIRLFLFTLPDQSYLFIRSLLEAAVSFLQNLSGDSSDGATLDDADHYAHTFSDQPPALYDPSVAREDYDASFFKVEEDSETSETLISMFSKAKSLEPNRYN